MELKPGSNPGKNDIITDEVKAFIMKCLDSDRKHAGSSIQHMDIHTAWCQMWF